VREIMKVYRFGDYDWVATNLDLDATKEWYRNEFGLNDDEMDMDFEECDLDKKGMYVEFTDEEKIKALEAEDIEEESVLDENGMRTIGSLMKRGGEWFELVSFRKAMEVFKFTSESEPEVIATTEW
jgi:hypothetical protein